MFHLFLLFLFFFIAHFLLVENTYKNPYSLKAVRKNDPKIGANIGAITGILLKWAKVALYGTHLHYYKPVPT
jgi:hypothetical protein